MINDFNIATIHACAHYLFYNRFQAIYYRGKLHITLFDCILTV